MDALELAQRNREILRAIINIFVDTGEPVGSRTLSKHSDLALSPATIRNIMSDLADAGFLTKPHISSGRLPTDLGYRFFVDDLMDSHTLTREEQESMRLGASDQAAQIEQVLAQATRVLSELTNTAGLVLLPAGEQLHFKHINFVKMSEEKTLAVIVSMSGVVQNRVIPMEAPISQDELNRISNLLNEEFSGLALREVREKILQKMSHARDNLDTLYQQALKLSKEALSESEDAQESLFVEGASRVFSQPDFATNADKLQSLYRTFEEREKLVRLLDRCLESSDITILIGSENDFEEMKDCSIVAQRYYMDDRPLGSIGIIGPKRMRYDRAVSLVEWTADSVSKFLSSEKR